MLRAALFGAAGALLASPFALAQSDAYPSKPVRIVIGAAPGGGLDATARAIHEKLVAALGQPVVIDNRPGAAGSLSGQIVAKAPPDGYTLCLGAIGTFAVNYSLYKNIGYHPLKDLAPITMMAEAANVPALFSEGRHAARRVLGRDRRATRDRHVAPLLAMTILA